MTRTATRIIIALIVLVLSVLVGGTAALAAGYNDSGFSYGDPYGTGNTGTYVRYADGGNQIASIRGPHGGYTTSTNKCKDCHAVHMAAGSFLLMRSDDRTHACDYCHGGGGGSKINIQMDNVYDADGAVVSFDRGLGTGHTLGYAGFSPDDIRPAFRVTGGLACFSCHTPHGAATRVLTTFADPGRPVELTDAVTYPMGPGGVDLTAAYEAAYGAPGSGVYDLGVDDDLAIGTAWGLTPGEGNIVVNYGGDGQGPQRLPVWPTGRFLLVKNPHVELLAGVEAVDTVVSDDADAGANKLAIDWDDPLGPASSGEQDAASGAVLPWNPPGVTGMLTLSEFCTDCHDGAAGASTQRAVVWRPLESDESSGTYTALYAHDAQPRTCQRELPISAGGSAGNPGDPSDGTDDNYGPSCRLCHVGAGSCGQCHGVAPSGVARPAYGLGELVPGQTQYLPNAYVHTSASTALSAACVDGGFSFPHRTLGTDMLKDELYGVDYDGTPVAAGEVRDGGAGVDLSLYAAEWGRSVTSEYDTATAVSFGRWSESGEQLSTSTPIVAENMDSVCIDCHGDASYYNGDSAAIHDPARGWELLLKGLP